MMDTRRPILLLCVLFGLFGTSASSLEWLDKFFEKFKPSKWDGLRVKWGRTFNGNFNFLPRTSCAAKSEGFVKVSDCDEADCCKYRGARYIRNGDSSLVLLFDRKGYIAGIQTVFPKDLPFDYPRTGGSPPFVEMDDGFYLTVYFVDPAIICSRGRSRAEFKTFGTGNTILVQVGPDPEKDLMIIPRRESEILRGTKWVEGKCVPTMGKHYWYNVTADMDCNTIFPVFAMYNDKKLNAIGWSFSVRVNSDAFEVPTYGFMTNVLNDPPRCLAVRNATLSSLHIFLTHDPTKNRC